LERLRGARHDSDLADYIEKLFKAADDLEWQAAESETVTA